MKCCKIPDILRNGDERGFTLLEGLLGMATFAITMSAMFLMLSGSFKASEGARGITEQSALASDQIENLFPLDYSHADLNNGVHPAVVVDGKYNVTYQIQQDVYLRNTKRITVVVQWVQNGVNKTVTIDHIKPDTI